MKKTLSSTSKKIMITALTLGVLTTAGAAYAAESDMHMRPTDGLAAAIATKFNVKQSDVQGVIDEIMKTKHVEMESERQARQKTRLTQAVANGKITQTQMDLILAKQSELQAKMEAQRASFQSLTKEQIKTKIETERTELKNWLKANNIPEEYMRMGGFGEGKGGLRSKK